MSHALGGQRPPGVLIVEDDPAQRRTLIDIMQEEGFQTVGCATATEALAQLDRRGFAVAILDLRLPDQAGTALLERIGRGPGRPRAVIHTAYGSYASAREAVNLDAFAYVEKGDHPGELVRQVHRAAQDWMAEALDQRERQLRLILRHSSDGINITEFDPQTCTRRLVACNDKYVEMSGRSREELMAADDLNRFVRYPDDPEQVAEHREKIVRGAPFSGLASWIRPDGKENYYEWTAASIRIAERIYIIGVDRDITERRRAEARTARQAALLGAVNRLFQRALTCETDADVARTCLGLAEELTGSAFGFIGEVNQAGRFDTIALSLMAWESCRLPPSRAAPMINDMVIRGIWGRVLKGERSLIVNDPASHPDRVGTPPGHPPLTCFLGVPLSHAGQTIGMIALANKESGYDRSDLQDIEALSAAFVEALMRKRAEEAVKRHERELQSLSARLVAAQEAERKRIARELHDQVGQALTAMGINLAAISGESGARPGAAADQRLAETRALVAQTLEQIRELSLDLRPAMLDDLGLVPALRWYVDRHARRLNIPIEFEAIELEQRLPPEVETAVYRAVQEALTNVARHAQAGKVSLRVVRKDSTVTAIVQDDGRGFDVGAVMGAETSERTVGLLGIRERAASLGGAATICSRPGRGTRVSIEIPLKKESL